MSGNLRYEYNFINIRKLYWVYISLNYYIELLYYLKNYMGVYLILGVIFNKLYWVYI